MISYFKKVSSTAEDLSWDELQRLLDSRQVEETIAAVRMESDHNRRGELKRRLPAVTWQSHFEVGARRSEANASPTGFFMLDVDHVEQPLQLWESCAQLLNLKDVLIAHITPSGKGLRIVMRNYPGLTTIADNQRQLALQLQLSEYDAACKDLSRLSYLCRRADVLFLNKDLFMSNPEIFIRNDKLTQTQNDARGNDHDDLFGHQSGTQLDAPAGNHHPDGDVRGDGEKPMMYKGTIPYGDIVKELVAAMGGEPVEGTRNTFLYKLARQLRYIVDFNPLRLIRILPTFGLPQSEVESVAQSAVRSLRSEKIPYALYCVLRHLEEPQQEEEDEPAAEEPTDVKLPPLPPVFKQFVRIAPDDFKVPSIMALLPIMGTLMSRLRAYYIDGDKHAPNFTTVVEAPQASGKSFARRIVKLCLREVEYIDAISRVAEQQYLMQLRKARNSKQQPEEPTAIVRVIPASVSIAKLLKRLCNAKGLHLFSFLEELDTMTKSNRAGAWSQKSDIYRNAFDNADYGQEYMSENSYSGIFPVYYNMLTCGTPAAVRRFYKDPEDGLVSRVIFCLLPSQFGAKMPVFKRLTRYELRLIENVCNRCNGELCCTPEQEVVPEHVVDMGYLNEALEEWIERERQRSIKEVSIARNTFYRRAAVIGFRAGMLAHYLYGEKRSKKVQGDVIRFACFVADYVLNSLLVKFAEQMEQSSEPARKEYQMSLYDMLPASFGRSEVAKAVNDLHIATPVRQIIWGWKANGYIEETSKFHYKKTA